MAYVVFALKWRPKGFAEIIGQDHVVTTLKNAIQKNRLAHAYLFAGPRGVGKTSTARILAKALNCKEGPTENPCGKCSSCLEIAKGQSLDVLEIDGASNRGIDEIRALRENIKFSPTQGKFKVYIIDEVHQITAEGFNALLKTLEEPPPFVKFIFATTHPHKVMPTILSRCHRLDFRRVSVIEIIVQLEKIVAAEGASVDKNVLFAIAKSSDGSLRDAESILDQLISFAKDNVSLADVTSMLGLVEQEIFFVMAEHIIKKDAAAALRLLHEIIDEGKDVGIFLTNFIEHFRNLMVAKVTQADAELIDLPAELCQRLLQQSQSLRLEEIFSAFTILVNTQEMCKRLDSTRIPLEVSLVRLANKPPPAGEISPAAEVRKELRTHNSFVPAKAPVEKQEIRPVKEAKPEEEPKQEPPRATTVVSLENIKEGWQRTISGLSETKMSVATYLNEGAAVNMQHNLLTISLPKNCSLHKEVLEKKENKMLIEKSFSQSFNAALKVYFILSEEQKQEHNSMDNPIVRSAMDMFQGRIVKENF
ncbi:MAG: DNA polymerase III subunit gamma/tau [Candidatus Omnitrophota bacterium]|jgi:DNA polymerase-3 subunit gamma/tau